MVPIQFEGSVMLVAVNMLLYNRAMWLIVWLAVFGISGALPISAWAQPPGRAASPPIGASMALLATLQDAGVLPPEGSAEANRVVQSVIQFQSVFMKSTDAAVEEFRSHALQDKWPAQAAEIGERFRTGGWTSEVLEAFTDYYRGLGRDQRDRLNWAFARANMRQSDFEYLSHLFDRARTAFDRQGQNIHEVFSAHRKTMPGRNRPHRKEPHDGDQSVYSDQGQSRTYEGRAAVLEETVRGRTGSFLLRAT